MVVHLPVVEPPGGRLDSRPDPAVTGERVTVARPFPGENGVLLVET